MLFLVLEKFPVWILHIPLSSKWIPTLLPRMIDTTWCSALPRPSAVRSRGLWSEYLHRGTQQHLQEGDKSSNPLVPVSRASSSAQRTRGQSFWLRISPRNQIEELSRFIVLCFRWREIRVAVDTPFIHHVPNRPLVRALLN